MNTQQIDATPGPLLPLGLIETETHDERAERIAARRAFVDMKATFIRAASEISGPTGELLQRKVRASLQADELSRLRTLLLGSLPAEHAHTPMHRAELCRQLDSLFPDSGTETEFVPL